MCENPLKTYLPITFEPRLVGVFGGLFAFLLLMPPIFTFRFFFAAADDDDDDDDANVA